MFKTQLTYFSDKKNDTEESAKAGSYELKTNLATESSMRTCIQCKIKKTAFTTYQTIMTMKRIFVVKIV